MPVVDVSDMLLKVIKGKVGIIYYVHMASPIFYSIIN